MFYDVISVMSVIAGSEYSATCSAERLQSAHIQISQVREATATAEKRLQQLEVKVIELTSKQEKERRSADSDLEGETDDVTKRSEDETPPDDSTHKSSSEDLPT